MKYYYPHIAVGGDSPAREDLCLDLGGQELSGFC